MKKFNVNELGQIEDLQSYLAKFRKIQEDVPYLRKTWLEIVKYESEKRANKWKKDNTNKDIGYLSLTDIELEDKFRENKYNVLEEAMRN